MKRILVGYISTGNNGGIDTYLMNFFKSINHEEIEVHFLTKEIDNNLQTYLKENNADIIEIPQNRKIIKQFLELRKIVKNGNYDIAYFNISESYNVLGQLVAKLYGVNKVITHSHSSNCSSNKKIIRIIQLILNKICKVFLMASTDKYIACSNEAAKWLFPQNIVSNKKYDIIYNAVDCEKFKSDIEKRKKIRDLYGIKDEKILGYVGRFCYAKNNEFLINIFKEYSQINEKSKLMCIGDGENLEKIKEYSKEIGLEDKIIFIKNAKNIDEYMQAFDYLLLPSRFEGLPIVGIEAQFSGITCLLSNKISEDVVISNNIKLLDITNTKTWIAELTKEEKIETKLLESANKYKLSNQKKQFEIITNTEKEYTRNTFLFDVLFKILFFIHLVINLTCLYNGSHIILPFIFIIGLFILYFYAKNIKKIYKDKIFKLMILFIFSYIISFIFNKNYNIVNNIKILIWTLIEFVFVFGINKFKNRNQLDFEINAILKTIILFTSIINIYNVYLLLTNTSSTVISLNGEVLLFGISYWGRFYGNFYDPNYASILCACAIIFSAYLAKNSKKTVEKILLILSIGIQFFYIVFSQSRTGLVSLILGVIVAYIVRFLIYKDKITIVKIFSALAIIIGIIIIPSMAIKQYNNYNNLKYAKATNDNYDMNVESGINNENIIENTKNENNEEENLMTDIDVINNDIDIESNITNEEIVENVENEKSLEEKIIIGRTDINSNDISNRRIAIWKSGLEIAQKRMLIGIGFANIKDFAIENLPNTYIVNNDFSKFDAFHNAIVDVFVSQGVFGLIILLLIIFSIIKESFKYFKTIKDRVDEKEKIIMLISVLAILSASSMLVSQIFFINNVCTYLFWLILGYCYYYICMEENK